MSAVGDFLNFSGRARLPVILQTEVAECGLACLAMIAAFHGHEFDLNTLRRRFPISAKGVTLKALIDVAGKCPVHRTLEATPTIVTIDGEPVAA